MDVGNHEAVVGSARVKEAIQNYVYFESDANMRLSYGKLQLRKGLLCYISNKGNKNVYYNLNAISELKVSMFTLISFKYPGKFIEQSIGVSGASKWISVIQNAQNGIYPNNNL